jgi:hypothetical protein
VEKDQKVDEQHNLEENAKFVRAALFLKQAEVKLGIPLLNSGSSPQRIEVDSTRRPKRPRRVKAPEQPDYPQQPAPGRPSEPRVRAKMGPHTRRCNVCRHPHRKDIEQEFLRWRSPDRIAQDYKIPDHSSIYRHVHATGIFVRRRKVVRAALEPIIECAEFVRVTASSLVKAIYAHTHINENGEWVNHPTHHTVIVQHVNVPQENNFSDASGTPSPAAQPAAKNLASPPRCHPASPVYPDEGRDEERERREVPAAPTLDSVTNDSPSPPPCHPGRSEGSALAIPLNSATAESRELNRQIQELEHAPTL